MSEHWQHELRRSVTCVGDLLTALELKPDALGACEITRFATRVPRPYLARMRKGDAHDPLLRQVLPVADENRQVSGYTRDAVGDLAAYRAGGIVHKYHGRALLMVTGACAVHCRYCFRRHFPYTDHTLGHQLQAALAYIAADPSIEEVILSGGDPLSLSNTRLFALCQQLEDLPQVRRIRIHTRLPIVIPSRLEDALCAWLNNRPKPYLIVFHINHAAEIDDAVTRAVSRLSAPRLLNQAVLLKGVNDEIATLVELSQRCFELNILPYYLHMLDRVQGTAHFEVSEARAKTLMRAVAALLPGYLVPKLVRDGGGTAKRCLL